MASLNNMECVILCGGLGTRLREETEFKPKPMVEIGGRPMLWHIMKYYAHSGFPGGIKEISFEKLIAKAPERVIEIAVKGMLLKGPLGRAMYRKLKVYKGSEHPHAAQQPQKLDI